MAGGERVSFTLRLGPHAEEALHVRRVIGVEALSAPFRFHVDFIPTSGAPIDLELLPGSETALCIRRPDSAERWVHAVCATVDLTGVEAGRPSYRAVLVPRLALLGPTEDCRVFQGRTAVEVATAVLDQHGVSHREALAGSYPIRDLCIQYRETDLAFVSRLLAEEGIAYWFEHSAGGHTMVLVDAPPAFPPLGAPLPFRREVGAVALEEHVYALRRAVEVVPGTVTLRDYDFERPLLEVTGSAEDRAGAEHYEQPSGNVQPAHTTRLARARLERLRFGAATCAGESTAAPLAPGVVFTIEGHPDAAFAAPLLAVRVEHQGRQETAAGAPAQLEDAYRNSFVAAIAERPWRPPGPVRGRILGPQTATVVGPAGEEIHTDRYGRVKVQFHWDRLGKRDDTASAWVRLTQSWAGPGMGAVVVPRIGQEVLVRFLEGDPDRPVVTGAVYNGAYPPPIELPRDRTQSTFRSATSPADGIGYNELRLEDQAAAEQVFLHGQKDEALEVRNDKAQIIHRDETLEVVKDRSRTVHGEQTLRVDGVDESQVGGSQALEVKCDRTTTVGGSFTEEVRGNQALTVGGSRTLVIDAGARESIGAAARLTIAGGYAVKVGQDMSETVAADASVRIAQASLETVGAEREETTGGDRERRVGRDEAIDVAAGVHMAVGASVSEQIRKSTGIGVHGPAAVSSKRHVVEADRLTLIVAGRRILSMDRSGSLVLSGTNVTIGGKAIVLAGASVSKSGPAAAAAARAKVEEARKLAGAPAVARFTLVDLDGQPIVNQSFELKPPAGPLRKGRTSAKGQAQLPMSMKGQYELTFAKPEGEDRTEKDARRGKTARKGARRVERGKPITLSTDTEHVLELAERVAMTIAFLFEPGRDKDYPRFVLESEDGEYRQERTPKDDLVKGDAYLELRFTGFRQGPTYKLTRWLGPAYSDLVFEHRPYSALVDQPRPESDLLTTTALTPPRPRKGSDNARGTHGG